MKTEGAQKNSVLYPTSAIPKTVSNTKKKCSSGFTGLGRATVMMYGNRSEYKITLFFH